MVVDSGDGRSDGDGAYHKQPDGTVYIVAGSSGQTGGGSLDHPVMFASLNSLGSLVLDVTGGQLDASFLSGGVVADHFTLIKAPECGVAMSQPIYGPGEILEISSFRLANLGPSAVATELKLWLEIPGVGTAGLINIGADGSLVLPGPLDFDLAPLPLLPVAPGVPLGAWSVGCRIIDPATGATWSVDESTFFVTE